MGCKIFGGRVRRRLNEDRRRRRRAISTTNRRQDMKIKLLCPQKLWWECVSAKLEPTFPEDGADVETIYNDAVWLAATRAVIEG